MTAFRGLENRRPPYRGTEGSNPSLSAILERGRTRTAPFDSIPNDESEARR
jgi:hypothetical protein